MNESIIEPEKKPEKAPKRQLKTWVKWTFVVVLWLAILSPYLGLRTMLFIADDGKLPGFDQLENLH